ncbi:MAG: DNA-processing protein DprA [Bacteroidaceae bacterium]|nr:DNA-processing protein DprA [Bacteroidaceae bacterium]
MMITEQVAMLALSRAQVPQLALLRQLIDEVGSAKELLENASHIQDILPEATPKLAAMLSDMSLIERAEREMEFIEKNGIRLLCLGDEAYPYRLAECDDAPLVLHSMGNADLNAKHIVSIVGTRHASDYGKELCENFVADLARFVPGTLIVSGLAYGIDVCAHRAALKAGFPTIGVLAHGLDRIYPSAHRSTAKSMLENGGLLTEFMSGTESLKPFFVQRNRVVAGMADATVVVQSASKGGSLITASIANSYSRDCFAFPGRVNDQYSQGCNELVSRNRAALITSAYDFVEAMNWEVTTKRKNSDELQGELFPELTPDEAAVMAALRTDSDGLQVNQMVVQLNIPINKLLPLLFEMEMKGYVKAVAGGCYRAMMR